MRAPVIRRGLGLALRVLVGAAVIAYLLHRMDIATLDDVLAQTARYWPWWIAGLVLTFLGLATGALRWHAILAAQGLRVPAGRVVNVFFIGQFFNAFMLGACGGDVVRAYYVSRDTPGKRAEAASTVFFDRAVGLFVMVVFSCAMIALRLPVFLDNKGTKTAGVLMFLFLAGAVAGILALFRRNLFEHWPFFQRLERDTRLGPLIRRTYDALYLYRGHPKVMFLSVAVSLLNLAFLTMACFAFGRSLQLDTTAADYFTLFPVISVIAAVPVTPGSLGVRESLFVAMFDAVGVGPNHALSLSLLVYLGSLAWSLFGGVLFLGYSAGSGRTLRGEFEAMKSSEDVLQPPPEP